MIINCPGCDTPFENTGKWGKKKFCGSVCSHRRHFSDESKAKTSKSLKGRKAPILSEETMLSRKKKIAAINLAKYLAKPFEDLGIDARRRRVLEEQNKCCAKCTLGEWLGQPITLEIEHKDGDNTNNARTNLEGLCPNYHSQTLTWKGKNKKSIKISDEDLITAIRNTDNIRQALLSVGLTPKGDNYTRAKKLSLMVDVLPL
jgi:hypothetical protein